MSRVTREKGRAGPEAVNSVLFHNRQRLLILLTLVACVAEAWGQCVGDVSTPHGVANCTARSTPQSGTASIDPRHSYSLAELIDIAEHNNPRTRVAWEHAKQKGDRLGIERSAYYPVLAGVATFADQQFIEPFPETVRASGLHS